MTPIRLKALIERPNFMKFIMYLIIFNSAILGLKSYPSMMDKFGSFLDIIDDIMIFIFVCELILYQIVYGPRQCFSDPWYTFDFVIISIAILPAITYILSQVLEIPDVPDLGHFSALRAMRVLRILRLISIFPNLRKVIQGLITAIPGIGSIGTILMITLYVGSLMATNLYGEDFPEWFGTLQASLFSLFQIMSTEGWPDIVRVVMKTYPYSWVFFIFYMLVATFVILNLFIAVIVDAMSKEETDEGESIKLKYLENITKKLNKLEREIKKLQK